MSRLPMAKDLARGLGDLALGSGAVTSIARYGIRGRLRILGYHGVPQSDTFASQMSHLRRHYSPVSPAQVVAAVRGIAALPGRAVWVTFDDGDPTVVSNGLPILEAMEIPATMFVCPGVVDTSRPYWWQVVEEYRKVRGEPLAGLGGPSAGWVTRLKGLPDSERRTIVGTMEAALLSRGIGTERRQITAGEIERFVAHIGTIGNHTWDHPCLDTCEPAAQFEQVERAHLWLRDRFPQPHHLFAYPNGNFSEEAARFIRERGYDLALMFDHRLARTSQDPLKMSRIRTSSTASPRRFAALVAGTHPVAHSVRSGLKRFGGRRRK